MGGGVTVENTPEESLPGLWFIVGNSDRNSGKGALFTPQQALRVISKIDSSTPLAGKVQARDGVNVPGHTCVNSNGDFNTAYDQPACVLYFQI